MANGAAWLSKGVESLRERLLAAQGEHWDCDVLIIGSGYGGAVAAARLAGRRIEGRPAEVWVLERGHEWLPGTFPARFAELPGAVRFSTQDGAGPRGNAAGLYDLRIGNDVSVLVGSGLGGGSLINAAVMARPADSVFEVGWPSDVDAAAMAPHYAAAERMLQVQNFAGPGERERPRKLVALDRLAVHWTGAAATAAPLAVSKSHQPTPAGVDRRPCIQCGDCVTGCNWQAKNSLDVNYLALAHQRGASLFTGVLALGLRKTQCNGTTVWEVDGVPTVPPAGTSPQAARVVVRARRVVVAAGTLGSTELLLRSRAGGLQLSRRLGERFSTNGDAIHAAVDHPLTTGINASDATPADRRDVGPTITGLVRHEHAAQAFVVQEFGIPAPLRRVLAEVTATFGLLPRVAADRAPPDASEDPLSAGDAAIAHTMIYGALGDDGAGGRIVASGGGAATWDARVRIDWPDAREHPLFRAQFDALAAAHAGRGDEPGISGIAVANPSWQPVPVDVVPKGPVITVHPLGGCVMGDTAQRAVVDGWGRVFDPDAGLTAVHDGLAVLDGSIVPCALAINPALTIAALAERAAAALAADWRLDDAAWLPNPVPEKQPRWQEPDIASGSGTSVRFEEALEGNLTLDAGTFWARLELRFEPVANLLAFVSARDRSMRVQTGRIVLYAARASSDEPEFSASPTLPSPLCTVSVDGEMRPLQPMEGPFGGKPRFVDYELTVLQVPQGCPLPQGTRLFGRKTLVGADGTNPLRQLSVMTLQRDDSTTPILGTLEVDLGDFVRRQSPLLSLHRQEDYPVALADLGAFMLFMLRLVFLIHFGNLLRVDGRFQISDQPSMVHTRRPGELQGLNRAWHPLRFEADEDGALGLTRYERAAGADPQRRPVMLVHGLSAGGSTFAHASIPSNLVQAICESGRVAWVLELRTSNVFDKHRLQDWTLEQIACDIDVALAHVQSRSGGDAVDVIAHCIGAAVFTLAALADASVGARVGAAVLSQVAPVLRMSPLNRLRGYLASYLAQYLGARLLDTRPDVAGLQQTLVDVLLNAFPYSECDGELARYTAIKKAAEESGHAGEVDFRTVRHRADALFGQLFELANLADETLAALDALFGAVRAKTLAQTIHYARWGLLADDGGRNRLVSRQNIRERMAFPLLLLHGRRNRVFDWRGSLDAHQLFKQTFADGGGSDGLTQCGDLHLGQGTARQLLVLNRYGHQDTLIGSAASSDVFPQIVAFLDAQTGPRCACDNTAPPVVALSPWIGPALGWLRRAADGSGLTISVQVHPLPSRARTLALAFVVLGRDSAGHWQPQWQSLGYHYQVDDDNVLQDLGGTLSREALDLTFADRSNLSEGQRVLVLTLHDDLPRRLGIGPFARRVRLFGLQPAPDERFDRAVHQFFECVVPSDEDLEAASFALDAAPLQAIDDPAQAPAAACFVVASCQYPPGLLDGEVADAAWSVLDRRLGDPMRPAPQWLLLLGDQVYIDETAGVFDPAPDDHVVERVYERTRRLPAQHRVRARLPAVCMLDDHEIRNDWQPPLKLTADEQRTLDAYRDWQACLNPPSLSPQSRSLRFAPGGWPVFVLDTRTRRERRGPAGSPTAQAGMIDPADWQALVAWLAAQPRAAPKFIACPSVLVPLERQAPTLGVAERLAADSGSGYPRTQLDLLMLVRDHGIDQVVLLAGDVHLSLACTLQIDGGPRVHAIVSSGLYAPWPFANERPANYVHDGPVVFTDGLRVVAGHMHSHAVWTRNGFVVVQATQSALSVEFHAADGGHCDRVNLL